MRPVYQTLGAAGNAPWVQVDYLGRSPFIGVGVTITSGASLTYNVQYTYDDFSDNVRRLVTISRTTTTATVTDVAHGLSTNDSVVIVGSGDANLDKPNGVDITYATADTYTYTVSNTGASADGGNCYAKSFRIFTGPAALTGATSRKDGQLAWPITGVRLNISSYASGKATMALLQASGHSGI